MKKALLVAALILGLLLLAAFFLVPRFDEDVVSRELVRQVERSSGLRISSAEIDLDLFRGVLLSEVSVAGRIPAGDLSVQIDSVRLRHRWIPLLSGRLEIGSITIDHPRVELVSRQITPAVTRKSDRVAERRETKRRRQLGRASQQVGSEPPDSRAADATAPPVVLSINRIDVLRGEIAARTAESDEIDFLAEEVEARLRDLRYKPEPDSSWTRAISGRGSVSTGRLEHGDFVAVHTRGSITLVDGVAEIDELDIQTEHAHIETAPVVVFLTDNPPRYSLDSRGEIDLNGVVEADSKAAGFGPVSFAIEAAGIGPEWITLTGEGSAMIGGGRIPPIPAVVEVESTIGRELLTGRAYDEARIDFTIHDQKVWLEPFELTAEGGAIEASGAIGLGDDPMLALELIVHLEPDRLGVEGVIVDLLDQLAGESGRLSVALGISGTLGNPRIGLGGLDSIDGEVDGPDRTRAFDRRIEEVKARVEQWLEHQAAEDTQ